MTTTESGLLFTEYVRADKALRRKLSSLVLLAELAESEDPKVASVIGESKHAELKRWSGIFAADLQLLTLVHDGVLIPAQSADSVAGLADGVLDAIVRHTANSNG